MNSTIIFTIPFDMFVCLSIFSSWAISIALQSAWLIITNTLPLSSIMKAETQSWHASAHVQLLNLIWMWLINESILLHVLYTRINDTANFEHRRLVTCLLGCSVRYILTCWNILAMDDWAETIKRYQWKGFEWMFFFVALFVTFQHWPLSHSAFFYSPSTRSIPSNNEKSVWAW